MIHLFKYMKFQVLYKINQCIAIITKRFEYCHEGEYSGAPIFRRALDLDKYVLIVLYVSFI